VITSIHECLQVILGSARQLVCRTRPRDATILNLRLPARVPVGKVSSGLLVRHGTRGVVICRIDDSFFLRAAGRLESMLVHIRRPTTMLILRMDSVPCVDTAGIFALRRIVVGFKRHGAKVLLVEVRPRVLQQLVRAGVIARLGADNVVDTLEHAEAPAVATKNGRVQKDELTRMQSAASDAQLEDRQYEVTSPVI
jgi:anti-anti-sigma regulatory factor